MLASLTSRCTTPPLCSQCSAPSIWCSSSFTCRISRVGDVWRYFSMSMSRSSISSTTPCPPGFGAAPKMRVRCGQPLKCSMRASSRSTAQLSSSSSSISFTATFASLCRERAMNTTPNAPSPSRFSTWYCCCPPGHRTSLMRTPIAAMGGCRGPAAGVPPAVPPFFPPPSPPSCAACVCVCVCVKKKKKSPLFEREGVYCCVCYLRVRCRL